MLLHSFAIEIIAFIYGTCIGSFLNVIALRMVSGDSFLKGRSHCDKCNHNLNYKDLFPIISFLVLKGKCRYCNSKISSRNMIIELSTGLFLMLLVGVLGLNFSTLLYLIFACIMIVVLLIDMDTMMIPDQLIVSIIPLIIFSCFIHPEILFIDRIIGFFIVSLPMYILNLIIKDSFGGGDIKLMAITGALLGWKGNLLGFIIAVIIGGVYGLYLLVTRKADKGMHIAFGPFLTVGLIYVLLFGKQTLSWYLYLF